VVLAVGCSRELPPVEAAAGASGDTAPVGAVSRVHAVAVEAMSLVEPVIGTGTLAAEKTTDVGARVSGIVERVHVRVGDLVREGDPLFALRSEDFRIRERQASFAAKLAVAEAAKSARDLARIAELQGRGVASDEQLDAARTASEIAAARSGAAESALAMARQDLADCVVRAPYPGAITKRYVDEGAMLSAQMGKSPGVQIMKTDLVAAIVQLPELQLPRVALGMPASVQVDGAAAAFDSYVAVLNPRVDSVTRAFEVRIPIENPALALRPGLFARAEIRPPPRDLLAVPHASLLGPESARHVFALVQGRAQQRAVQVRELDATRAEVLSGLAAGEQVLVGPELGSLREGTPVAPELASADR
jgi:RND family efflux transporter MFP subunit